MPKQMRRAALRSALSVKAADNHIVVLDALALDEPKTKAISNMLVSLGVGSSALILLPESNENLERSIRNLGDVAYLRAQYLNIRDLMRFDTVLMPKSVLDVIEGMLG
jgi:large subunit ribosomal protein L4